MSINEFTAERIRWALSSEPDVYEKRMFGGLAFMVNGKMCVVVSGRRGREDLIMVRVGPRAYAEALKRTGAAPTIMKGRAIKGYVDVDESGQRDLTGWLERVMNLFAPAKAPLGVQNKAPGPQRILDGFKGLAQHSAARPEGLSLRAGAKTARCRRCHA